MGSGSGLSLRQINRIIKKIKVEPGCVLVIKADSAINHNLQAFTDELKKLDIAGNIVVLVAADMSDIEKAPPEAMRKAGWYRQDDLAKMLRSNPR